MSTKIKTVLFVNIIVLFVFTMLIMGCAYERNSNKIEKIEETVQSAEIMEPVELTEEQLEEYEEVEKIEPAFYLSDYERQVVEKIVMGEAGGEPYEGQVLVAQCILNASLKDGIQPSEVRTKYKYSGWNENPSDDVKNAVSEVFDRGYKAVDEYILYFYAPKYAKGTWHETQKFVIELGGHRFFSEWE